MSCVYRKDEHRQRRGLDYLSRHFVDIFYRRFYGRSNYRVDEESRSTRAKVPVELRPVAGPISIEQLPAMLAARHVKQYPYSQRDDPAIM